MTNYHLTFGGATWQLREESTYPVILESYTREYGITQSGEYIGMNGGGLLKVHHEDGALNEEFAYPDQRTLPEDRG